jgi:hypothetical protein
MLKTLQKLNAELAVAITDAVGSMWCAYAFALLALVSLPAALHSGPLALVSWISQTFLQLVLLSVIMVGQDVASRKSERRALKTYQDAEKILAELKKIVAALDIENIET